MSQDKRFPLSEPPAMAHLPPFRTRRSEPVISFDDSTPATPASEIATPRAPSPQETSFHGPLPPASPPEPASPVPALQPQEAIATLNWPEMEIEPTAEDDVPVLTQVVEPSPLIPTLSDPLPEAEVPEATASPELSANPIFAEDDDEALIPEDEDELLDILADEVTDRIQAMLRELVRTALQEALAARRRSNDTSD